MPRLEISIFATQGTWPAAAERGSTLHPPYIRDEPSAIQRSAPMGTSLRPETRELTAPTATPSIATSTGKRREPLPACARNANR
jgi:hypothetical protein